MVAVQPEILEGLSLKIIIISSNLGERERGKVDSNKVHLEMRLCGGLGSITTYIDIETFLWIITRLVSDKFY